MARKPAHDTRGTQKGPQQHAEGQHGEKTHERFIERLHEGLHEEPLDEQLEHDRNRAGRQGKRRLVEDREQHDHAEKNSEHKRLYIERERDRDDGPVDTTGNLHGELDKRSHRADYQRRGADGLRED